MEQSRISTGTMSFAPRKKTNASLYLGLVWAASMVIFAAVQLFLGTDEIIVLLAFLSLLCCAVPLLLYGIYDISAVFIFVLLSKYSFFPLWIKTFLGERLDIGLNAPLNTFSVALAGSVIACIALFLTKLIPVKKRVLGFSLSERQMLAAGYLASTFGLFFLTLHIIFGSLMLPSGEMIQGFGGFGSLIGPLYFGIVCLTVVSMRSNANPIHKISLLIIFLLIMLLSLRTTAKVYFTLSVFAFVAAIFYFSIRIKKRYLVYLGVFAAFYAYVFAPVLHLTRTTDFQLADIYGKISILEDIFNNYSILTLRDQGNQTYNLTYYPSAGTFLVDRFEMIADLDIAVGGISRKNTIGWIPFQWAFETSLPSFIFPNKPAVNDIDLIAFNAGYFPILTRLNHTMGVFGSAYAMFLWPSLVFITLTTLGAYILVLRLIVSPDLMYNLFGVFFLARYSFNFSEQSVQLLLSSIIRSIPIDVALILGICFVTAYIFPNIRKYKQAPSF